MGESNQGPLALATSVLATELLLPTIFKFHISPMIFRVPHFRFIPLSSTILLQSLTQQTTNYMPSEHHFGFDQKHLPL